MTIIYLVQDPKDLRGANGYSVGLLEAEHSKLLVSFLPFVGAEDPNIHPKNARQPSGKRIHTRKRTMTPKRFRKSGK